jgi:hypothetical protein
MRHETPQFPNPTTPREFYATPKKSGDEHLNFIYDRISMECLLNSSMTTLSCSSITLC